MATYGDVPLPATGLGVVSGTWLRALSGGLNRRYINGLTASGSSQADAKAIPYEYELVEFDTVTSSTGANLPPALQGSKICIYNNGAQTLTIYPAVANNPVTAAQDTINNGTSTTQGTHTSKIYYCAKDGVWAAQ